MDGTLKWIVGGLVGVIGIFGLFLAANAEDRGIYVFAQMKQGFDASARSAPGSNIETAERNLIGGAAR